ncbi:MAG: response regulator transcription factor [Pirellulaceae bacterium]|nr:response regulator transcription factor [Pirellulaceae bacterium]
MNYSVFIIDDHPVVRLGLRTFLHHAGLTITGEVNSGENALIDPGLMRSDVVLLDIRLPGMDGLETLQRLRDLSPGIRVLLYSGSDNPTYQARGIALGAVGIVQKTEPLESLLNAIVIVAQGGICWSRDQRRRATTTGKRTKVALPVSDIALTQREIDVLMQLANGLTNKEIALSLGIGYETVKEHVQHVLRKLGVTDRTQAAVWAVRQKVV